MNNTKTTAIGVILLASFIWPASGCQDSPREDSKPLSTNETQRLLAPLPTLVEQADDKQDFLQGPDTPPPPSSAQTVQGQFPSPRQGSGLAGRRSQSS